MMPPGVHAPSLVSPLASFSPTFYKFQKVVTRRMPTMEVPPSLTMEVPPPLTMEVPPPLTMEFPPPLTMEFPPPLTMEVPPSLTTDASNNCSATSSGSMTYAIYAMTSAISATSSGADLRLLEGSYLPKRLRAVSQFLLRPFAANNEPHRQKVASMHAL